MAAANETILFRDTFTKTAEKEGQIAQLSPDACELIASLRVDTTKKGTEIQAIIFHSPDKIHWQELVSLSADRETNFAAKSLHTNVFRYFKAEAKATKGKSKEDIKVFISLHHRR